MMRKAALSPRRSYPGVSGRSGCHHRERLGRLLGFKLPQLRGQLPVPVLPLCYLGRFEKAPAAVST